MTGPLAHFPPAQAEAEQRLAAFAPLAGAHYAEGRGYDFGPGQHNRVSTLSPYIHLRMLDEVTVARAVLDQQPREEVGKFMSELFWRTYLKGWMELRPGVWDMYLKDISRLGDDVQTQSGLRRRWEEACLGQTGIAPFDDWAKELVQTGYLHNHARLWFASIWIFTLDLPWQLGADFFLRHLLDGDVAVNTLSWRWVAGIQTRGKTYIASQENIAQNTFGRYRKVPGLAQEAPARTYPDDPAAGPLPDVDRDGPEGAYALLLHADDIDRERLTALHGDPRHIAYLDLTAEQSPWAIAPAVTEFRWRCVKDQANGADRIAKLDSRAALRQWATGLEGIDILTPYAPVGPHQSALDELRSETDCPPLRVSRRALDSAAWPLATKGFFPFRKHIPDLIDGFILPDT
ncbi:MAG: FAD-binding domain-containing protein [Sulfitobacter sp.]|nr:FAD-binding domain-containing protein [Sulfitobacter sp.]